MNIIDIVVIILIIFGALIGLKRGFTRELVSTLGLIVVLILSFSLKNVVAAFLYDILPFFKFGGIIKGVTVLNILLYEVIAFLIVFSILMIGLRILMVATKIFETVLNMTIILGIPSKIAGAILGMLKWCVIAFMVLYVLALPVFNFNFFSKSSLCNKMLTKMPILSNVAGKSIKVIEDFTELKSKYETAPDANTFNLETLDLFLEYKVVSIKTVDKLISKDKLVINNVETVLSKHR